jgi:predicted PurR-regulated permease PerM
VIVLIGVVGVVAIGAGVQAAAGIVAPAMLGLVLTLAVLPVGAWARSRGWPSWLATLLALVAAYAILAILLFGTIVCLIKLVDLLPQYAGRSQELTGDVDGWMADLGLSNDAASDALGKMDAGEVADLLTDVLAAILDATGNLFFLVTVMFFFVTAIPGFGPRMAALRRSKPDLAGSLTQFVNRTQRYLVVTALFGAIVAVLDAAALWLLAIPLPLAWGFFSFRRRCLRYSIRAGSGCFW